MGRIRAYLRTEDGSPIRNRTIYFYEASTRDEVLNLCNECNPGKAIKSCVTDENGKCEVEHDLKSGYWYSACFPGDEVYTKAVAEPKQYRPSPPPWKIVSIEPSYVKVDPGEEVSIRVVVQGSGYAIVEVVRNSEVLVKKGITISDGEATVVLTFKAHTDIYPVPRYRIKLIVNDKVVDEKYVRIEVKFNIFKATLLGVPLYMWLMTLIIIIAALVRRK